MRDSSSDSNDGNVSSTSNTVNLSGASRIETVQSGLVRESILDCALIACETARPFLPAIGKLSLGSVFSPWMMTYGSPGTYLRESTAVTTISSAAKSDQKFTNSVLTCIFYE